MALQRNFNNFRVAFHGPAGGTRRVLAAARTRTRALGGVPVARRCRKSHGFAPPCRPAPPLSNFVSDFAKIHDFWVVFECQIPIGQISHPLAPQVRGGGNATPQNRPSENYTKVGKSWQNRDPKWTKRPGRAERRPAASTDREELAHMSCGRVPLGSFHTIDK